MKMVVVFVANWFSVWKLVGQGGNHVWTFLGKKLALERGSCQGEIRSRHTDPGASW